MSQILILEGNDGIVLSQLCKIRRLPPPVGYASEEKFKREFIKNAGGVDNALIQFNEALRNNDYTNIGLVVDANDEGPVNRWENIKGILANHFDQTTLMGLVPKPDGILVQEQGLPTVGVWIMPDNQSTGYLEHFVANMVPDGDKVFRFAESTIQQLEKKDFCNFSPNKRQKALLYTWLAWQTEPGKPFGTALESKYLNAHAPIVEPFLEWMNRTFQLA